MTKIKHSATGPNGETFTRTSKTRSYTHMAIGRPSYDAAVARANSPESIKGDRRNFAHYNAFLNGTSEFLPRKSWERDDAAFEARVATDIARATSALAGCTDADSYAEAKRLARVADVEASKASGVFDRFVDLGWSSRFDLAQKVAASAGAMYAETRVIEAVQQA